MKNILILATVASSNVFAGVVVTPVSPSPIPPAIHAPIGILPAPPVILPPVEHPIGRLPTAPIVVTPLPPVEHPIGRLPSPPVIIPGHPSGILLKENKNER
jgi:hypothetical protein